MKLIQFKRILFQALYALYVAQKEYKFVHNDLHAKNVLLQDENPEKPFLAFQDFDRIWYTSGDVVKITDFGLSRLQLETREVVHNPRNSFGEMFSSSRDLEKLAMELPKITDWATVPNAEEQRVFLRKVTSKMKQNSTTPKELLREAFFDDLGVRPENVDSTRCSSFSSHGNTNLLRRILDGEDIKLPPASDPSWLTEDKDLLAEQFAAMAQLQERFRILRKQQPNLYIQYIAKSYVKAPRPKKKVRRPSGPRPPRPPKPPKPLVTEEKPREPVEPAEPLTRDERRQQNDAVRWFREMKEVAGSLAALGAVLAPRKARTKHSVLATSAAPKAASASSSSAAPVAREVEHAADSSPYTPAPTKLTAPSPTIVTSSSRNDEDMEVDIIDDAPARSVEIVISPNPEEQMQTENVIVDDEPAAGHAVPVPARSDPERVVAAEPVPTLISATALPKEQLKKKRRKTEAPPTVASSPRSSSAPQAGSSEPQPKKRSLYSIMNEIATNCSSLAQMFESEPVLGRRRAASRTQRSAPRTNENEAVVVSNGSTDVVVSITTEENPGPVPQTSTHPTVERDPSDLVGLLDEALYAADVKLLPIEERGRSRDKIRRSRDAEDDRPLSRADSLSKIEPQPASSFNSSGAQTEEEDPLHRASKRLHVDETRKM